MTKERWIGIKGLDGDYQDIDKCIDKCIECNSDLYFDYNYFRHYDDLCKECLKL